MSKSMKPGGGGAFEKLKNKLAAKPGITNPGGLAAKIGREKFGKEQMGEMSARGRERAAAERKGEKKPPLPKVEPLKKKGDGLAEAMEKAAKRSK
ncbi:MAG: hypothetical protein KGL39_34955 [Patescibacteria group bacterium]|nr:hypothetical protein [Patescibacteria group bacterium]